MKNLRDCLNPDMQLSFTLSVWYNDNSNILSTLLTKVHIYSLYFSFYTAFYILSSTLVDVYLLLSFTPSSAVEEAACHAWLSGSQRGIKSPGVGIRHH